MPLHSPSSPPDPRWLIRLPTGPQGPLVADLRALAFADTLPYWPDESPPETFALLDAARFPGLPETLAASDLDHASLFRGAAGEDLADVAPWLVRLAPDHALTRQLLTPHLPDGPHWHRWGRGVAVLMRSAAGFQALWRHFRKYTRIYDDQRGKWNYFRFYAPETLRGLVAHMPPAAFAAFARPVQMFLSEDHRGHPLLIGAEPARIRDLLAGLRIPC